MKTIFLEIKLPLELQASTRRMTGGARAKKQAVSLHQPSAMNDSPAPCFESKLRLFFMNGVKGPKMMLYFDPSNTILQTVYQKTQRENNLLWINP